jgi:hypothetical protein
MANSKCRWQCPEDWCEWSQWLAAGLHARNRWRLPVLLVGILFAHGRRTVTTWLRAAGVSDDYQDYFYFLIWVTLSLAVRHPRFGPLALPRKLRRGQRRGRGRPPK